MIDVINASLDWCAECCSECATSWPFNTWWWKVVEHSVKAFWSFFNIMHLMIDKWWMLPMQFSIDALNAVHNVIKPFMHSFQKWSNMYGKVIPLSDNPPPKMFKHTETTSRLLPTNCLSVFGYFLGLGLKGLNLTIKTSIILSYFISSSNGLIIIPYNNLFCFYNRDEDL